MRIAARYQTFLVSPRAKNFSEPIIAAWFSHWMEKCMSAQSESKGPVILFCILWWVLAHEPDYESHAFLYALALMLIGWLAIRLAGNAYSRLGKRAVFLMLQV